MSALTVPAFDPASPDAQMLEAYESVRAARLQCHLIADLPSDPARDTEAEQWDDVSLESEKIVCGAWATTMAGIRTRLQLLLPDWTGERWVDLALSEYGISAIGQRRDQLDGNGQQLALACEELLHADWEDALATYEKSVIDYELALSLQGLLDGERQTMLKALGEPGEAMLAAVAASCEIAERQFRNTGQIDQLMRALAPTHAALSHKIEIMRKEGAAEEAAPWIARDVQFLAGLSAASPSTNEGAS